MLHKFSLYSLLLVVYKLDFWAWKVLLSNKILLRTQPQAGNAQEVSPIWKVIGKPLPYSQNALFDWQIHIWLADS